MTFLFLEGEHPLSRDFSLSNISSVSLTYQEDSAWIVNVSCSEDGKFVFENVENIIISNLTMLGCYGNQITDATSFALVNSCIEGLSRNDLSLESANDFDTLVSCNEAPTSNVLSISASNIQITSAGFEHNVMDFNTTVLCVHSHSEITIENTTFQNNAAACLLAPRIPEQY